MARIVASMVVWHHRAARIDQLAHRAQAVVGEVLGGRAVGLGQDIEEKYRAKLDRMLGGLARSNSNTHETYDHEQ